MPLPLASIERVKLAATFCNSLATAVATVGIFAPPIYLDTTLEIVPTTRQAFFFGVMAICGIAAAALHLVGQATLALLESHDLQERQDDSS